MITADRLLPAELQLVEGPFGDFVAAAQLIAQEDDQILAIAPSQLLVWIDAV